MNYIDQLSGPSVERIRCTVRYAKDILVITLLIPKIYKDGFGLFRVESTSQLEDELQRVCNTLGHGAITAHVEVAFLLHQQPVDQSVSKRSTKGHL